MSMSDKPDSQPWDQQTLDTFVRAYGLSGKNWKVATNQKNWNVATN